MVENGLKMVRLYPTRKTLRQPRRMLSQPDPTCRLLKAHFAQRIANVLKRGPEKIAAAERNDRSESAMTTPIVKLIR
jgi:hypothetical protein